MSRELLKINEIFETIQGEGTQTGTASVFVRLQGCDVGCAFCDTKHTWADDTGSVKKLDYILNKNMDTEDLTRATNYFIQGKYTCQIETSGTEEIKCNPKTWVTVSPKINMSGGKKLIPSAIERANEIKMPIGKQKDIDILKDFIKDYQIKDKSIYLQPLSQSKKATELCVQSCIDYNWKISIQTHKYIGLR